MPADFASPSGAIAAEDRQEHLDQIREELQGLLYKIGHRFIRKYHNLGWTHARFDEVMSEVYYRFIRAVDAYQGGIPVSQWVRLRVSVNIRDVAEAQVKESQQYGYVQFPDEWDSEAKGPPFVEGLLLDLSEDAAAVVKLITERPPEMQAHLGQRPNRKTYIRAVAHCLKDAGWTLDRLRVSFKEIRRALR